MNTPQHIAQNGGESLLEESTMEEEEHENLLNTTNMMNLSPPPLFQYNGTTKNLATSSTYTPEADLDNNQEEEVLSLLQDSLLLHDRHLLPPPPDPSNPYSRGIHLRIASAVMRKVGHYLATITLLTMLIFTPIVLYQAIHNHHRKDLAAFDTAGVMVLGTVILSTRLVYLHLTHWYMPDVQKYVVRILWMVPLYSIQSWLSLRFHQARIYIDTIRDLYEAYVIASFLYYLIELLGGQESLVIMLRRKNTSLEQHAFPFSLFLQPWTLGLEFMLQCKHGVLQYVVVKCVATLLTFILEYFGHYGEGQFVWTMAYPYLAFCLNVSVMYALYCLVRLFHAVNYELQHPVDWKPLGKFLCVKGVVFFTWWQSVLLFYIRAHTDWMNHIVNQYWSEEDVANGVQDYCICMEMVGFAIAHSFTFTYKEYLPRSMPEGSVIDGDTISYEPPTLRTLQRPMGFKDAFWSSTLPKETLNDIQRLRNGVDKALSMSMNMNSPGGNISLGDMDNGNSRQERREEEEEDGSEHGTLQQQSNIV